MLKRNLKLFRKSFGAKTDDVFHTVVDGDRIDLIAYRYLGRAELWWVNFDYNELFFPFDLELGRTLRFSCVEQVEIRLLG